MFTIHFFALTNLLQFAVAFVTVILNEFVLTMWFPQKLMQCDFVTINDENRVIYYTCC